MRGIFVSPQLRQEIILLRQHGKSLPEISKQLGIPKTTVFKYIKGVQILKEFQAEWLGKRGGSKKRKLLLETEAAKEAKKLLENVLTLREKLLFLCALYWAEGNKSDFILTNTDPQLVRVFIECMREVLKVEDERIRVSIRIYEDLNPELCLQFWSKVVNIPKEKFLPVDILQGKKKGKLMYGMCRVRVVKGGILLKNVMAINKAIAENFVPIA